MNFGAFIRIDDNSIKAKYGWFGKIDCKLSDVTFAMAQVNTLIIELKDGKTHTVMGVGNALALASDYTFFKSYESEIFENIDQLQDTLESSDDITDKVLHKV